MDLSSIDKQITSVYNELEQDTTFDLELKERANELASKLLLFKRQDVIVNGKLLTVSYIHNKGAATLVVIDHLRLKIAGFKYKPATFVSTFDENYTELENLQKLVFTFYYYKYDKISSEDIIEEADSDWEVTKNQEK